GGGGGGGVARVPGRPRRDDAEAARGRALRRQGAHGRLPRVDQHRLQKRRAGGARQALPDPGAPEAARPVTTTRATAKRRRVVRRARPRPAAAPAAAFRRRRHRVRRPPPSMALRTMTQGMVDRLFWRAGFGANDEIRRRWAGKPLGSAVTWLLATPQSLAGAEPTNNGRPLDPRNNDTDLVLAWLDRMVR